MSRSTRAATPHVAEISRKLSGRSTPTTQVLSPSKFSLLRHFALAARSCPQFHHIGPLRVGILGKRHDFRNELFCPRGFASFGSGLGGSDIGAEPVGFLL